MLLWSNLGVKPAWLLGEMGNSALEADTRIPPNKNKKLAEFTLPNEVKSMPDP